MEINTKQSWKINRRYRGTDAGKIFCSLENAFSIKGEPVARSPISRLEKVKINARYYYVKTYTKPGKHLRRFIGRSRIRAEWENLQLFEKLGIPTPKIVAYGQEKRNGMFHKGAMVTEEIPNTTDLAAVAQMRGHLLDDRTWTRKIADQIADCTGRLHEIGFIHSDLKWRNILVTLGKEPQIYFIDCPAGRIHRIDKSERWYVKDIACLDKIAKYRLPATERLRFFLKYRRKDKIDLEDKRFIKKVLVFFKGRE